MWIDDIATDKHLRAWVKNCPAMKLVSTMDGKILWANSAFCEWSRYTLGELVKLTWMQLSVHDESITSDLNEMKLLDSYNPYYSVTKQYIPKNDKPQWGQLTVMRYPMTGDIECCLCTWEPLKNGTATAFAAAMEHSIKIEQRLMEMTQELKAITSQTDEERLTLTVTRLIVKYPRVAISVVALVMTIAGANNLLELISKVSNIHIGHPQAEAK